MDLLERLIDVHFRLPAGTNDAPPASPDASSIDSLPIVPRQPLRGELTISFRNPNCAKDAVAMAFLSQVGEHSLISAWRHLLARLTLVPFLLDLADVDDLEAAAASTSSRGAGTPAPPTPPEDLPTSDGAAVTATTADDTAAAAAAPGSFAFGVPAFWNDKLYAHLDDEDEESEEGSENLYGVGESEEEEIERAERRMTVGAAATSNGASRSTNNAPGESGLLGNGGRRDTGEGCSNGYGRPRLPCRAAGEAMVVSAEGERTVTEPSNSDSPIPASIVSTYPVAFTVPDVSPRYLHQPVSLAFVALLSPLMEKDKTAVTGATAEATAATTVEEWPPLQRYMCMRVLSRAFVNPFDGGNGLLSSRYGTHTILLGCQYVPVCVRRALACRSVTCPLSNDRLLLNLNLTNVSCAPVVLHSASLDIYSTTTTTTKTAISTSRSSSQPAHRGGSSSMTHGGNNQGRAARSQRQQQQRRPLSMHSLWAEQRAGPAGANMRRVDLLTKIVTVTPMIVSDDRPPFTLHAGETYAFQFAIEVLPQLCYLLNPKSLQYVYARHARQAAATIMVGAEPTTAGGVGGGGGANGDRDGDGRGFSSTGTGLGPGPAETVITDCYGVPVTSDEIISVLSSTYLSYLFVYYDLLPGGGGDDDDEPAAAPVHMGWAPGPNETHAAAKADGLHIRHAATWSFGAS